MPTPGHPGGRTGDRVGCRRHNGNIVLTRALPASVDELIFLRAPSQVDRRMANAAEHVAYQLGLIDKKLDRPITLRGNAARE